MFINRRKVIKTMIDIKVVCALSFIKNVQVKTCCEGKTDGISGEGKHRVNQKMDVVKIEY